MKKTILILGLIILSLFAARFLFGGSEDTWICQEGEWIKHGNPKDPPPETGCKGEQKEEIREEIKESTDSATPAGLANPAAIYCLDQNGTLRYEAGEGGVRGVCIIESGQECDEWEYFRSECP
ncbi:DUF333 domain-containing protein [Patescibacteria group bacterium]